MIPNELRSTSLIIHHCDQVNAARAEFGRLWEQKILPDLKRLPEYAQTNKGWIVATETACWRTFLKNKGLLNP